MPLSDYQVNVISPTSGTLIQIFDSQSFVDMHYTRILNGIGALVITFASDTSLFDLFPLDALIDVKRTNPLTGQLDLEETFFVRLTHRFREDNDERFIVGGMSLNHLLTRRLVDPADDPLQAGGYSTKAGPADSVMREYALEQMVTPAVNLARIMPDFSVATVPGIGIAVGQRLRYENLFEVFQDLAARGGVDFIIRRMAGRMMRLFIAPIGSDKTYTRNYPVAGFVILNPLRGNLSNPSLELNRKEEANFIYALGQGPGEQRITLQMAGDGITDSPWNRIEFKDDVRNVERGDSLAMLTQARTLLKNNGAKIEFTFDVSGQEPGNAYKVDWDIGDIITAEWDNVMQDLRITGVEFEIGGSQESLKVITEVP